MLDYLPHCSQRLRACLIAHQLLRCLGLLLIVQADSSLREACQSSWRTGLEAIGFEIVSCNKKKNLYCMAFRKVRAHPALDDDKLQRFAPLFRIPQDTRPNNDEELIERDTSTTVRADRSLFDELPADLEL